MDSYLIVRTITSDSHKRQFKAGDKVTAKDLSNIFSKRLLDYWLQRGIIQLIERKKAVKNGE